MAKNEDRPKSKYFTKHFNEEETFLYPQQCPRCKCWFAIDDKWAENVPAEDMLRITCPYCARKFTYYV